MRITLAIALACLAPLASCSKSTECPVGETDCNGRCVSLLTDHDNCGACGVAGTPLQQCQAGTLTCAPGVGVCGEGACTDLARDPANCGACGTACAGGQLCSTDTSTCVDACLDGSVACGGACVRLDSDWLNCGACGNACAAGQTCRSGSCASDLAVACYVSSEVYPLTADLDSAGTPWVTQGSPTVLAMDGSAVYSGNAYPGGITVFPLDARRSTRTWLFATGDNDVQAVAAWAGTVLATNDSAHTVVLLDPGAGVLDEIEMPGASAFPHGLGIVGTSAWVALYGDSFASPPTGQQIAKLDLSGLPACAAGGPPPCGSVTSTIDLTQVEGAADPGSAPFPSAVAVHGSKVYVTLANVAYDAAGCGYGTPAYCYPSGNGKLAVIDTSHGDAVHIVDLSSACKNPGDIEISGDEAWVSCGAWGFPDVAPGTLVKLDLSGADPKLALQVDASTIVPGKLAICGQKGYVTDQSSGAVLRFDTATGTADAPVAICPAVNTGGYSWAWAADVVCPTE